MIQYVVYEVMILGSSSDYHRFKCPINCSSIESESPYPCLMTSYRVGDKICLSLYLKLGTLFFFYAVNATCCLRKTESHSAVIHAMPFIRV